MEELDKKLEFHQEFITQNKLSRIDEVLNYRTRHMVVALEDIYQSQNASAVLRSCDCFGIQDVHVIENTNQYNINKDVSNGAEKWVDLLRYNQTSFNTLTCIEDLKAKGYQIVTLVPEANTLVDDLPIDQKTALFFGTEMEGLSDTALAKADHKIKIPMFGFTQSFNISVSAALTFYGLITRLHKSNIDWQLAEVEKKEIKLRWFQKIKQIKYPDSIEG